MTVHRWGGASANPELRIAAASDLTAAFKELVANFEKQSGTTVKLSFGSSGNFFAQISNGAPFDLYFSADIDYPKKLEQAGLVEPGSLYEYAVGKIVLWAPNGSAVDVEKLGLSAVQTENVRKIAIANPAHAPYGRAAVEALKHAGLHEKVSEKLVLGENISQAAQFVQSGNADLGIIALSLALAPNMAGKGKYWEVPADHYPELRQAAVIVRSSPNKRIAEEFLAYMKSAAGQSVMKKYGFVAHGRGTKE